MEALLRVENLRVAFRSDWGLKEALDGVSFAIYPEETLCLVGESGSGKSVTALSIMGLLGANAEILDGKIFYGDRDLLSLSEKELDHYRGNEIAMIFQDAMGSLNPVFTIGNQVVEAVRAQSKEISKAAAVVEAKRLLCRVGLEDIDDLMKRYPNALSGGMQQRVMIAMALAGKPKLLIADEATTALDVTIQAQIMKLLKSLQAEMGLSLILITHDIGLVGQMADRVMVMYAGQIVEQAGVMDLFHYPAHPYTRGLMRAVPSINDDKSKRLVSIEGQVPEYYDKITGCRFMSRCPYKTEGCEKPQEMKCVHEDCAEHEQKVRCHLAWKGLLD
jgi:peptide/nickel transport system ATP-binding protein